MTDMKNGNDAGGPAGERMLKTKELAKRWNCSTKVLEKYRYQGGGCEFEKIGSMVRYPLSRVVDWERANLRGSTSEAKAPPLTPTGGNKDPDEDGGAPLPPA